MVMLKLTELWINLAATGEALHAPTIGRAFQSGLDGEVRTYGGGRQRFIAQEGVSGTFAVTLRRLTLAQVELLELWRGQVVQIRDHRGQRWFAVYPRVERTEYKGLLLYDATITASLVTFSEAV